MLEWCEKKILLSWRLLELSNILITMIVMTRDRHTWTGVGVGRKQQQLQSVDAVRCWVAVGRHANSSQSRSQLIFHPAPSHADGIAPVGSSTTPAAHVWLPGCSHVWSPRPRDLDLDSTCSITVANY